MKLNNKGFAITGILYTVLILFLLLLSSLLLMLRIKSPVVILYTPVTYSQKKNALFKSAL